MEAGLLAVRRRVSGGWRGRRRSTARLGLTWRAWFYLGEGAASAAPLLLGSGWVQRCNDFGRVPRRSRLGGRAVERQWMIERVVLRGERDVGAG